MYPDTEARLRSLIAAPDLAEQVIGVIRADETRRRQEWREHQRAGIEAARCRKVALGRPPVPLPCNFDEIYRRLKQRQCTQREAAQVLGVSRSTLVRMLRRYQESRQPREC